MSLPTAIDQLTATYKQLLQRCIAALQPGVPDERRQALADSLRKVVDHKPGAKDETRMEV